MPVFHKVCAGVAIPPSGALVCEAARIKPNLAPTLGATNGICAKRRMGVMRHGLVMRQIVGAHQQQGQHEADDSQYARGLYEGIITRSFLLHHNLLRWTKLDNCLLILMPIKF